MSVTQVECWWAVLRDCFIMDVGRVSGTEGGGSVRILSLLHTAWLHYYVFNALCLPSVLRCVVVCEQQCLAVITYSILASYPQSKPSEIRTCMGRQGPLRTAAAPQACAFIQHSSCMGLVLIEGGSSAHSSLAVAML